MMAKLAESCRDQARSLARAAVAAVCAASVLWTIAGAAADAAVEDAAAGAETDAAPRSPQDKDDAADRPAAEVFNPTEEISEDLAVAFPVDI